MQPPAPRQARPAVRLSGPDEEATVTETENENDNPVDPWLLRFDGFDPEAEGYREALCTLGNGYWGTRGAAPEARTDAVHYPGTYLAGVYNPLSTEVHVGEAIGETVAAGEPGIRTPFEPAPGAPTAGVPGEHVRDDEHLVNAPNWLSLWFRTGSGSSSVGDFTAPDTGWFHPETADLLDYNQELDLRRGLLTRLMRFRDARGRVTRVQSRRFVSQASPHVAVLETTFVAEDWSGPLTVRSAIDGRVANRNVATDRLLAHLHLMPRTTRELRGDAVLLEVETTRSGIHIAMAARTRAYSGDTLLEPERRFLTDSSRWVAHEFDLTLESGVPLRVEKVVVVSTSRDRAILSPSMAVATWLGRLPETAELLAAHEREWEILWDEFAVHLHDGSRQSLALNVNTFHVLQTVAAVDADLDAGVPARGLHGEGYRGHVFWDEMFVYPVLTLRRPDLSRILLGYRYRRLGEARAAATAAGHEGARFPWQSGIDGREVTPTELFNPRTNRWMPDHSGLQHHVGLAIAYSVWGYYQATGDVEYLIEQGAELLLEIARFFASLTDYDDVFDRFDIGGTMGPDEFHDGLPGHPGGGVRTNAYTNVMVAWLMRRAVDTVAVLEGRACRPLWNRLRLGPDEVDTWERIGRRLRLAFHADGVISQFDGYEALPELDWAHYRDTYGSTDRSLGRLDLILNAEGDSSNNYRVAKQADVLMLLYLFSAEELRDLVEELGYSLSPDQIRRTVEFYRTRSTHGSTLSNVVHSWVDARADRERSWDSLCRALTSDLDNGRGGTTHEGIHLGAMAGSVDMVVRCYTGLEIRDDMLWLHPVLPARLEKIAFSINYRDQSVHVEVTPTTLRLQLPSGGATPIRVRVEGREAQLYPGQTHDFVLGTA
ncbi:glycoside hydrolase family 65 protein [Cryobacterium sp. TMN-39-2]|nr:family 65 glycosyl hydrolase [Cryobacterium zongtaii]TFC46916.1 glycoside hydrolase family 65 protein [Cryobacterium sp. TMN-39-2]